MKEEKKKREEIREDRNKGTGRKPETIRSSPGDGAGLGFEVRLTDPGPRRSKPAALNGESGGGSRLEAKVKVMHDVTRR